MSCINVPLLSILYSPPQFWLPCCPGPVCRGSIFGGVNACPGIRDEDQCSASFPAVIAGVQTEPKIS